MTRMSMIKRLSPKKLADALQRRGARGLAWHGVRRLGTVVDRALAGPSTIRINPMGFVCNHTCPMCWLQHLDPAHLKEEKKRDIRENLKLADYEKLLDSMPGGLEMVNIVGGGEPLAHRDAVEIMKAIKTRGVSGSLITNGSLLKPNVADAMLDMRWDSTRVSVHAGDAETFKAIQGVDHYQATLDNLKYFSEQRKERGLVESCDLVVFHVLQKENIENIDRLFEFATAVGADSIVFEKIIPYDEEKWLTPELVSSARAQLQECAARYSVPFNRQGIDRDLAAEAQSLAVEGKPWVPAKRCSVGFDEAFIDAMGNVLPCCFSNERMGNVREAPFLEIWNSAQYSRFRSQLMEGRFRDYCISNRCHLSHVLHND